MVEGMWIPVSMKFEVSDSLKFAKMDFEKHIFAGGG